MNDFSNYLIARMRLIPLVCEILQENKIAAVAVRYNGSGDEGFTEEPEAFSQEVIASLFVSKSDADLTDLLNELQIPDKLQAFESSKPADAAHSGVKYFWPGDSFGEGLRKLLDEFVPEGYENNEGGTGYVVLNAVTKLIEVEHGNYVTTVEWHTRKFNDQGLFSVSFLDETRSR